MTSYTGKNVGAAAQGRQNNSRAGGAGVWKRTFAHYDVIITSEFELKGYFSQTYASNRCCIS